MITLQPTAVGMVETLHVQHMCNPDQYNTTQQIVSIKQP